MRVKLAPSLMCANLLDLATDIKDLERAQVDLLHIDVMDGHFVPNLALSFDLAERVARSTALPVDLHLMVKQPESFIESVRDVRAASVSFHIESTVTPLRLLRTLKSMGLAVGVAVNPSTPAEALTFLVEELDYVLLMTVEPGFAGQKFVPQVLPKIRTVRQMLDRSGREKDLAVDGNLSVEWASKCIALGATVLIAGSSSVFREGTDLFSACREFRAHVAPLEQSTLSEGSQDLRRSL